MNNKETGLEDFIERHRADFDVFEPRPDLWDDIEQHLAAPTAGTVAPSSEEADDTADAPLRLVKLYPDEPTTAPADPVQVPAAEAGRFRKWLPSSGMAAAVALLLLAGIGAVWSNEHQSTGWARTAGTAPLVLAAPDMEAEDPNAGLYFGASPVANATEPAAQHLTTAVHRMENYYAAQISERKDELRQLEAQTAVVSAPPADWQRELAGLDSTYRQLKVELYRNPEPDVVLEAMNRNLQIRLDILNQQTRSREQVQEYHAQPLMIADNYPMP